MLHEKPILVAFAVSQRPLNAKLGHRTISPASASTSSSSDSAIGTTSPSSTVSISPTGTHEQQHIVNVAFAIQPENSSYKPHIHEITMSGDLDADITEITRRIGDQALLISTTEDVRQVLHPYAAMHITRHLNVGEIMDSTLRQRLPPIFSQYVSVENLPDIQMNAESFAQLATVDRCRAIMSIINDKNLELLNHVETINEGYTPFVNFDRRIDSSLVIRLRGLPWQASDQDIALFFAGLNITPGGIALCLGSEGRRNGESLVCFECNAHRELALRRHRKFLHSRYIEVYRATGEEFNSCFSMGSDTEVMRFITKDSAMIVRMRGLPFDCTEADIRSFFGIDGDSGIMDGGVMFVNRPDGRPIGDAFVLFVDDETGKRALLKHKHRIGNRYIELFRTTQAEVQQIINRAQQRPSANSTQQQPASNANPILQHFQANGTNQQHSQQAQMQPVQFQTTKRDCLRLRGLPYEAMPAQLADFLGPHAKQIVDQGIHMVYNSQGNPSGEAFIQMRSEQAANCASLSLHNKNMEIGKKRRYIEVFQCSLDEMQSLLNPLQPMNNSLQGIPLNLAASANPALVQTNLQLAPHLQNVYRNLAAANFAHPMQHFQLHGGLNFAHQPQMSLLGIPTSFGTSINHLQMFNNDPQLHLQQQQLNAGLIDPILLQQQLGALPAMQHGGLDLATAAALIHHQQALLGVNGMATIKDFGQPAFLDLKQKLDIQHHC